MEDNNVTKAAQNADASLEQTAEAVMKTEQGTTEALLTEIRDMSKKRLLWQRISGCSMVVIALAVVISLIRIVPEVSGTLTHVNDTAIQAQATLSNVDELKDSIMEASTNINTLVGDNAETLTTAVTNLSEIDFEGLNQAIQDLQDAIGPMAAFMKRFGG